MPLNKETKQSTSLSCRREERNSEWKESTTLARQWEIKCLEEWETQTLKFTLSFSIVVLAQICSWDLHNFVYGLIRRLFIVAFRIQLTIFLFSILHSLPTTLTLEFLPANHNPSSICCRYVSIFNPAVRPYPSLDFSICFFLIAFLILCLFACLDYHSYISSFPFHCLVVRPENLASKQITINRSP